MTISLREPLFPDNLDSEGYITFKSALTKETDEDKVVKLSAAKTVALCDEDDRFDGVVRTIDQSDKAAGVQMQGFATVAGSGITIGYKPLAAWIGGGVKLIASPAVGDKYYLVVDVNDTTGKVTFRL